MLTIRKMQIEDVPFAYEQTRRETWATTLGSFEMNLKYQSDGCFIAEERGRPIGMVTTCTHGESAWIGNLIVVPDARSRGVGRALIERGLAFLEDLGIDIIRLDGDPPGIALYRSLGFEEEWVSKRFSASLEMLPFHEGTQALPVSRIDDIAAIDRAAFGDNRLRWLRGQRAHSLATAIDASGGVAEGYLFVDRTTTGLKVGPWIASSPDIAHRLMQSVFVRGQGQQVTVGIPEENRDACQLVSQFGFVETAPSLRMRRGSDAASGCPHLVYGINNGAVG